MPSPLWLEYRLDRLTFQNGETLSFGGSTRMLYEPDDHVIKIEMSPERSQKIAGQFDRWNDPNRKVQELKRIEYAMLVNLPEFRGSIPFYHVMDRGNGVALGIRRGDLVFYENDERPMFSKNFTLGEVSQGEIDSSAAVWQFHGYRHEH